MPALPGTIALTNIADGASIVAADHRNNYAAIQAAVNALIALFSNGSVDGDPMVWDGTLSKWVAASTLAAGRPRAPRVVTSAMSGGPPSSPVDQDIWIATGVDANGTRWQFQYNAGSASASKWEFIGGATIIVDATPALALTVVSVITAIASASFTASRAGDYETDVLADLTNGSGAAQNFEISPSFNGTSGFQGSENLGIVAAGNAQVGSAVKLTGVAAGNAIQSAYFQGGQPFTLNRLTLRIRPVRIT